MKTYHLITLLILLLAGRAFAQGASYGHPANEPNDPKVVQSAKVPSTIADLKFSRLARDKEGNTKAELNNVLINEGSFYFKLRLSNRSSIPYDIDFIRFYIRDLKAAKRTVTQEEEVYPDAVFGQESASIAPAGRLMKIFRLNKFTLPDDKALFIELYEKDGARHMSLEVSRSDIEDARTVR
ncbi:DUF4138 domain-containing protein [Daejeonella sp. JGW-45]|uniref:DUF4138 domain-containing protein n=1 Tax=Daejeonella sp. JGW-45 TaxID=3034148 RepID=UPI0023EBF074|nr:DUF4138 domain-containing protein [Daejeonella sp. JGW-45]